MKTQIKKSVSIVWGLFVLMLSLSTTNVFAQKQIIGKWLSEDKEGITEIYEQNGKFFGKLTWLKKPTDKDGKPFTDTENPDKSKTHSPLIGLIILSDLIYKNNEWSDGKIYDPQTGKTYSCTLKLSDSNTLKVRGYWGIFYQTQKWTKVQ